MVDVVETPLNGYMLISSASDAYASKPIGSALQTVSRPLLDAVPRASANVIAWFCTKLALFGSVSDTIEPEKAALLEPAVRIPSKIPDQHMLQAKNDLRAVTAFRTQNLLAKRHQPEDATLHTGSRCGDAESDAEQSHVRSGDSRARNCRAEHGQGAQRRQRAARHGSVLFERVRR